MPTIVSFLVVYEFRPKDGGGAGGGVIFDTRNSVWEELDLTKGELLLGYHAGEKEARGVTQEERAVRSSQPTQDIRYPSISLGGGGVE